MAVLVVGEVHVQPDRVAEFKAYLAELLPDTRAYDGCRGVEVYEDEEKEVSILFFEHWESRGHQEKYVAWRTDTGVMAKFGAMLEGTSSVRYFRDTGI